MKILINFISRLRKRKKSFEEDWYKEEPNVKISSARRAELKRKGFPDRAEIIYDFVRYGEKSYATDRNYRKMHPFSETATLINNKAWIPANNRFCNS